MRVAVTGSSGLVGTALRHALARRGHTVHRLVRNNPRALGDITWEPVSGRFDLESLEGVDAVVNLAGASVASGRWIEARKRLLRTSRVEATRHLVDGLATLRQKPAVFVSASAVGYYADRGDEELTEKSPPGTDFLARLAADWEAEALRAEQAGIRTVILRFGVILAATGGALGRMLLPFRLGLGGRLGSGRQWMSWFSLSDAVGAIRYVMGNEGLRGVFNAVAPEPVRNVEFTKALGRVLGRPTIFPAPAFALRLALGELADALLLASQRVFPRRLEAAGYPFQHASLELALRNALGRG